MILSHFQSVAGTTQAWFWPIQCDTFVDSLLAAVPIQPLFEANPYYRYKQRIFLQPLVVFLDFGSRNY
jgi:hypothetical protein